MHIQNVPRLDDQAPASPNGSSGHQGAVLGERELLSWTVEIGDAGDDQCPLFENFVSHVNSLRSKPVVSVRRI